MRGLLKIVFAAGVTALAAKLIRDLLSPGQGEAPESASAPRQAPRRSESPHPGVGLRVAQCAGTAGGEPSRDELYREAARLDVKGRSKMNKRQLQEAVEAVKTGGDT